MKPESREEDTELKIRDKKKENGSDERVKENNGDMSEYHFSDSKNEDREENRDGLEDSSLFYTDKNVMSCDLPETVLSDYKDHTHNIVKDICVDEGVTAIQDKFLFNGKDSVQVNTNESKSVEESSKSLGIQDSRKLNQGNLIVSGEEVKDDSEVYHGVRREKSSQNDLGATSGSVSKEALSLGEIISMEDSQKLSNNNHGPQVNIGRETEQEEPIVDSLRYLSFERAESKKPLLNDELEDSYDHHHLVSSRFQNGFGERSFSEAESGLAHITYSGAISVSGNLSVRSDGSTVSAHSFAFPILQSEWNSSPERMVKDEKRQRRKEKGWRHYSLLLCCRF